MTPAEEKDQLEEQTREELYDRATELDIEGRSSMNKEELADAIAKAEAAAEVVPEAPAKRDLPPSGIRVDSVTARSDEDVHIGHFCEVVAGEHEGRYGVLEEGFDPDKDGYPTKAIVRTRDEHDERLVVNYGDCRPAEAGRR